ncbi:Protein bli-3 [Mycena venus]|uniref:Protein bli-3 n=1 Tax=Mycena venus TaxID=2733690 RepID=A0A8H6TZ02_9AGAR|nr:Protein bli-3 [Mycena venus]
MESNYPAKNVGHKDRNNRRSICTAAAFLIRHDSWTSSSPPLSQTWLTQIIPVIHVLGRSFPTLVALFQWVLSAGGIWYGTKGFRNSPRGERFVGALSSVKARAPVVGGNFGVFGGLLSAFDCAISGLRKKEDPWNAVASGFMTGGCSRTAEWPERDFAVCHGLRYSAKASGHRHLLCLNRYRCRSLPNLSPHTIDPEGGRESVPLTATLPYTLEP